MILQELCRLYDRLDSDPEANIAKRGFFQQGVAFEVVISSKGALTQINDLRKSDGRQPRNRSMLLPGAAKPSGSGLNPSIYGWDRTDYMLGYLNPDKLKDDERAKKLKRTGEAHRAYREKMLSRKSEIKHPDYDAFCTFLQSWSPDRAEQYPVLQAVSGLFGVVRIQNQRSYLHEVKEVHAPCLQNAVNADGQCLVTGKSEAIARLHGIKIKGVNGAQSSGAAIVSFNLAAFESYEKSQSKNASVGEPAAFSYATALNYLLERQHRRRVQVGDTSVVFWAAQPSLAEDLFGFGLGGEAAEDNNRARELEAAFELIAQGEHPLLRDGTPFYVLGLAPNASRLSVRFWYRDSVGAFLSHLQQHEQNLNIVRSPRDRARLPLWLLLAQTARESKEVSPLLGGALLRSILTAAPYPESFLQALIRRNRAERDIRHPRAAAIKAVLIRNYQQEITMSLNRDHPKPAYQLGRLFAVLERNQESALPGINATVKDRFFGAASATPGAVFPRLLRLEQHHIAKLEGGLKVHAEKQVQEIMGRIDSIDSFPGHLDLVAQGLFALGYYHQRQDFFTKKDKEQAQPAEH